MSRRCCLNRAFSSTKYSGPASSSTFAAWVIPSRKLTITRASGNRRCATIAPAMRCVPRYRSSESAKATSPGATSAPKPRTPSADSLR